MLCWIILEYISVLITQETPVFFPFFENNDFQVLRINLKSINLCFTTSELWGSNWSHAAHSESWWAGKHAMYSHHYCFESGSQPQRLSCPILFHLPVIFCSAQSNLMKTPKHLPASFFFFFLTTNYSCH